MYGYGHGVLGAVYIREKIPLGLVLERQYAMQTRADIFAVTKSTILSSLSDSYNT